MKIDLEYYVKNMQLTKNIKLNTSLPYLYRCNALSCRLESIQKR